jgi:undecaprenyl-diphosphatase
LILNISAFLQRFFSEVINIDRLLFSKINQDLSNPVLDLLMPFITDLHNTIYLLALVAVMVIFSQKLKGVKIILGVGMALLLSDIFAAKIVKPIVHRSRPEMVLSHVRLIVPSQKSFGFPSNHTSNCYAAAAFLGAAVPQVRVIVWLAAFLVAYSRIYVGVHFPIDVLAGAFFGIFWGLTVFRFWGSSIHGQPVSWLNKPPAKRRYARFGRR